MKLTKTLLFVAGTAFGSLGFKALASKDAKRAYTKGLSVALKGYDEVVRMGQKLQSEVEDIYENAKLMNKENTNTEEF